MSEEIKNILERALSTFLETFLAMVVVGNGVTEVDWLHILNVCALSTIISLAKNILVFLGTDNELQ